MSSVIYNSCLDEVFAGRIAFGSDDFYCMLVNDYVPDKVRHNRRSHVTGEVAPSGTYAPGGAKVETERLKKESREDVVLGGVKFANATIRARGAVYYKSHGGIPEADELVAFISFGKEVASTNGRFELQPSVIRIEN